MIVAGYRRGLVGGMIADVSNYHCPLLLAALLATAGCSGRCDADGIVADMAGQSAEDCGVVPIGGDRSAAFACALDAAERGVAFHVGWHVVGTDSEVRYYRLRTAAGEDWALGYDGDPSGGSGAPARLSAVRCVGPFEVGLFTADSLDCLAGSETSTLCAR